MEENSHRGRLSSWVAVVIVIVGFALGGVALTRGPAWPLFWTGIGVVVVGGLALAVVGAFGDVVLAEPRMFEQEVTEVSIFGTEGEGRRGGSHGETSDRPTREDPEQFPHG
jgi:hypothetical protein